MQSWISRLIDRIPQPKISLGWKLFLMALVLFIGVSSYVQLVASQNLENAAKADAEKEVKKAVALVEREFVSSQRAVTTLAISLANQVEVQSLYKAQDRDGLYKLLEPTYRDLKERYQIAQIFILDQDGFVFLRMDEPENFDDQVAYRSVVSNAIQRKEVTVGFEISPAGPGAGGVAPMMAENQLLGLVEVVINYDKVFLEELKQRTNADLVFWMYNPATSQIGIVPAMSGSPAPSEAFTFYAGTRTTQSNMTENDFTRAQELDATLRTDFSNLENPTASTLLPLRGANNELFGLLEVTIYYKEAWEASQQTSNTIFAGRTIAILVGLLFIGVMMNFWVLMPIHRLSNFAGQYIQGQTQEKLTLRTGDEFEHLARQFNEILASVSESQEGLERLVQQRTAQLQAVNEVAVAANSILESGLLIKQVIALITEKFGYYYAAIFLTTENGRWAELRDATGTAGEILKARHHRLQVGGNSMVGMAINDRRARVALDVGETPVRFNNPLLPNTRSEIALPLIVGERVIGALDVQSTRGNDFREEDIATLQSMANQVATALENARLFREMNDSLEELRQANQQYISSAWADKIKTNKLEFSTQSTALFGTTNDKSSEVAIPLTLREQPIGEIKIETNEEWSMEDQSWVEALATQVAISLENSRLLEESQQAALRERLSASIIQKLWTANNVETILQTAARELGRALEASEASIELKTDD